MKAETLIKREARRAVPRGQRIKRNAVQALIYVLCVLMAVLCLLPLWLLFIDATRSTTQINQGMSLLPSKYFFINFDINYLI